MDQSGSIIDKWWTTRRNAQLWSLWTKKRRCEGKWESQIETDGGGRGPKDFQEQVQNNIAILHLFINSIGKNNYVYECISSSQQEDSWKQFLKK